VIAKGASRSGPRQLAVYLMRVERYATGEPVVLLEFQSPWASGLDFVKGPDDVWSMSNPLVLQPTADKLIEGFRDWQILTEGTKQGRDGLYHAEISPAPEYADTMTPGQWKRAADILGEELGLQNQPRAIVLHGGTDGRKHMHIVWQRTDVDTMKVIPDAYNYVAHEKASHRMELEFGHEFVPGKHAKRDRKRQPKFPRQKLTQAEDQYQKRTGLSKDERIKQITALHATADSGAAFKAALEDAGYILAKGERGYIIVDEMGGHSLLSRNAGLKKKEMEAFMAGVPLDKLPTIEEAQALQAGRRKAVSKSDLSTEALAKADGPEKGETKGVEQSKFMDVQEPPKAPEPAPEPPDAALEAKKKALAEREAAEMQKWTEYHGLQQRQLEFELNKEMADKLAVRAADDLQAMNDLKATIRERQQGVKGLIQAIENRWNPQLGAERAKERRREIGRLKRRQAKERKDYEVLLEQVRQEQVENLKERQAQQLRDQRQRHVEEAERYVREHEQAKELAAEIKAEQEELKRNESREDGPPPPKLGK
jgi:hypothetical protein